MTCVTRRRQEASSLWHVSWLLGGGGWEGGGGARSGEWRTTDQNWSRTQVHPRHVYVWERVHLLAASYCLFVTYIISVSHLAKLYRHLYVLLSYLGSVFNFQFNCLFCTYIVADQCLFCTFANCIWPGFMRALTSFFFVLGDLIIYYFTGIKVDILKCWWWWW